MSLEKDESGTLACPKKIPTDAETILELMDEASKYAQDGNGVTSPTFDHSMRIFNQLNAHYQLSWWLAAITILLGIIEILKVLLH